MEPVEGAVAPLELEMRALRRCKNSVGRGAVAGGEQGIVWAAAKTRSRPAAARLRICLTFLGMYRNETSSIELIMY